MQWSFGGLFTDSFPRLVLVSVAVKLAVKLDGHSGR